MGMAKYNRFLVATLVLMWLGKKLFVAYPTVFYRVCRESIIMYNNVLHFYSAFSTSVIKGAEVHQKGREIQLP